MKLSFIPADLHLIGSDGHFKITFGGSEVFRSSSRPKALKRFNDLKKELEPKFPVHEYTEDEKRALLQRLVADTLVGHNSLKPEKKKSPARGTRTFG